jgi:hypothetical protein
VPSSRGLETVKLLNAGRLKVISGVHSALAMEEKHPFNVNPWDFAWR